MTINPQDIKTFSDAEAYAAAQGIAITASDRAQIAAIQAAERERLQNLAGPAAKAGFTDRFNAFYPRLLAFILGIGETILTLAQTFIVSFGVPLVLALLLIVEHQRVVHGIALFEADYTLASFAAAALVLLNLVLEFQVHYIENAAGYHEAQASKWSLRIWARNALYTLGIGENWQAQHLSPAARYKRLLSLVTFSILALALVGSMKSVMSLYDNQSWYTALVSIVTESNLTLLMTWLGGLLFAAAAVFSAQGLSRYVAIRCVEIVAAMKAAQNTASDPHAAAIDEAGASAVMAMIAKKQLAAQEKAEKAAAKGRPASHDMSISMPSAAGMPAQEVTIHPDFLAPIAAKNGNGTH